jgi:hypothetical protein
VITTGPSAPTEGDGEDPTGNAGTDPAERYQAVTSRLDELEAVLRGEVERQRQRAERAEAQLGALGDLADHADELVAQAREDARRVVLSAQRELEEAVAARAEAERLRQVAREELAGQRLAARAATPAKATGPGLDDELLQAIRDHLVDMGAVQRSMIMATREAVIKMLQASGATGPAGVVRPAGSSVRRGDDGGNDQDQAANQ